MLCLIFEVVNIVHGLQAPLVTKPANWLHFVWPSSW